MTEEKITAESVSEKVIDRLLPILKSSGSVSVSSSVTLNLGNYESARIEAGLTLPLNPSKEDIKNAKKTFQKAWSVVEEELGEQASEVLSSKK